MGDEGCKNSQQLAIRTSRQPRIRVMSWKMKNIAAYKRRAVFAMVVVMCLHIFTGLRPFCANALAKPLQSAGTDPVAIGIPAAGSDRGEMAGSARENPESQSGPSNCSCKKQKKCPAIPRVIITSNPTHRFNEVQRQAKTLCCEASFSQATDHRFVEYGHPPLMEWAWCTPFSSTTSRALTYVLLI